MVKQSFLEEIIFKLAKEADFSAEKVYQDLMLTELNVARSKFGWYKFDNTYFYVAAGKLRKKYREEREIRARFKPYDLN